VTSAEMAPAKTSRASMKCLIYHHDPENPDGNEVELLCANHTAARRIF
jgi:hypothetical protein